MREAGASIIGGHSVRDPELKFGYAVTGVVRRRRMLLNSGARPGDRLLLTKPLGTGILSTALKLERLEAPLARRLSRQMATLNRAAAEAAVAFGARAATDVTGFGLIGHASQMADASGVSFRLLPAKEWFLPRVLELAAQGVSPGGLHKNREFYGRKVGGETPEAAIELALHDPQTSGGLLLAVPARRASALVAALKRRRVWVTPVGEVAKRGARAIEIAAP
jgi:selenide,water dikinase